LSRVIKKAVQKPIDEKQEIIINELIEIFKSIGYTVRIEKGFFKGGFCLLREQKLFLLNKNIEASKKINFLAKNLAELEIETIFLKPEIRDIIERERTK
jgi:hypothetical protein